jgi:MFS family permease
MVPIAIFWFANQFLDIYIGALIIVGFITSIIPLRKNLIAPVVVLLGDFIGTSLAWNLLTIWQIIQRSLLWPEPPDNIGTFFGFIMLIGFCALSGIAASFLLLISSLPKRRINLILSVIALILVGLGYVLSPIVNRTVPVES